MKRALTFAIFFCVITTFLWGTDSLSESEKYWHQWRGPEASGVAPHGDPPIKWNENKNIRWKTEIPGQGHATPIVWDDTIFVTSAIKTDKQAERQIESESTEAPQRRRGRRGRSAAHHLFTNLQFSLSTVLTVASAGSRSLAKRCRMREHIRPVAGQQIPRSPMESMFTLTSVLAVSTAMTCRGISSGRKISEIWQPR